MSDIGSLVVVNKKISLFINNYVSLFAFIILAVVIPTLLYILSRALSSSLVDETLEKTSAYECGFVPFSDSRIKFDIGFYIVSLLFVIFDLELVFLFPWSVVLRQLDFLSFFSMVVFFGLLTIGFIFEWNKGALDIS